MNRAARIGIVGASVVIFCYAGIGHVLGRTPDDRAYKSLTVYAEVLQKIQQDYVDEPNMHTVTAGSLHGLLESLDPYSGYLSPREYADYKDKEKAASQGEVGATLAKASVKVEGVTVPQDGTNGWSIDPTSSSTLLFNGTACTNWRMPNNNDISFAFPCSTIIFE